MEEHTDEMPCLNCITLPICRGILNSDEYQFFSTKLNIIMSRCSLFMEYLYNGEEEFKISKPFTLTIHNKRLIKLITYISNTETIEEIVERSSLSFAKKKADKLVGFRLIGK
jgi:hypothetical protein